MQVHEIKIEEKYFNAIRNGVKLFELRKNDRNYQVDDLVKFIVNDRTNDYLYQITYVLENVEDYGLKKGYCIFGIKPVKIADRVEHIIQCDYQNYNSDKRTGIAFCITGEEDDEI